MGIRVSELTRESIRENETVRARSRNTAPESPERKTMGRNTITEVNTEAVTGAATFSAPFTAASKSVTDLSPSLSF